MRTFFLVFFWVEKYVCLSFVDMWRRNNSPWRCFISLLHPPLTVSSILTNSNFKCFLPSFFRDIPTHTEPKYSAVELACKNSPKRQALIFHCLPGLHHQENGLMSWKWWQISFWQATTNWGSRFQFFLQGNIIPGCECICTYVFQGLSLLRLKYLNNFSALWEPIKVQEFSSLYHRELISNAISQIQFSPVVIILGVVLTRFSDPLGAFFCDLCSQDIEWAFTARFCCSTSNTICNNSVYIQYIVRVNSSGRGCLFFCPTTALAPSGPDTFCYVFLLSIQWTRGARNIRSQFLNVQSTGTDFYGRFTPRHRVQCHFKENRPKISPDQSPSLK